MPGRPFRKRFSQTDLAALRFPVVADSRIRSVNQSPLGAASRSFADSLFVFYECARRKSRKNSGTYEKENVMRAVKHFASPCDQVGLGLQTVEKANAVSFRGAFFAEESLFLFVSLNLREILRFAQNDNEKLRSCVEVIPVASEEG
jgi:hypothetical protein